jgi:Flp pilus assembly pilin Flp
MRFLFTNLIRLREDDKGADLVEYALLASMIAVAGVAVFPVIGEKLDAAFSRWGNNVYQAWEPENPLPPDPPDPGP